ncbi:MAG: uroporphyrinogen decarboxylase [Chloroflexi bacterium]|nr:uroporphyrinogen decarboxylase [Chloroflexota bacterium]
MLTHRNRLVKCLENGKIDRVPVALWRHFPVEDQSPGLLAKAIVQFQERYDFDFVKITPASSFCIKDWGAIDKWKGNPEGSNEYLEFPIRKAEDWKLLTVQNSSMGSLAAQLECIRLIRQQLPADTPIVQTIFNPLSQAKNLVGKENLIAHLRLFPDEVKAGLQVITETTIEFLKSAMKLGVDGIFYAIQHAQASEISLDEFDQFSLKFDLEILSSVKQLWFNIAHLHGNNVYFEKISKYPVDVINWHDLETPPDLNSGKNIFPGVVCGGLKQWQTLVLGSPEDVIKEGLDAIRHTDASRFILGTGCVLPITSPESNILAVRKTVEIKST